MSEETAAAEPSADLKLQLTEAARSKKFDSALESTASFAHHWRIAELFAASQFVPDHYKNKAGECLIAIEMAKQMREHPLMLMQATYMVKGRPGFSSAFMISRANQNAGLKSKIRWRVEELDPATVEASTFVNRPGGKKKETFELRNVRVTAYATDEHGETIDADVDTAMAVAEDWISNTKYQSMFVHMMKWRSAAFLVRLYMPEVMMGQLTVDELETLPAGGSPEGWSAEIVPVKQINAPSIMAWVGQNAPKASENLDSILRYAGLIEEDGVAGDLAPSDFDAAVVAVKKYVAIPDADPEPDPPAPPKAKLSKGQIKSLISLAELEEVRIADIEEAHVAKLAEMVGETATKLEEKIRAEIMERSAKAKEVKKAAAE